MSCAGSSAVAAAQSSRSARASARSPSKASTRARTRLTLPSRIATRSPKQNAAIAAAVERPMPGSSRQRRARRRELAAVLGDDDLRAAMEIARARVVAEAAPGGEHLAEVGGGQRADVGEARGEALVVGEDGRHLRLLQHDLGEPDAVRVARVLPGQRMAAVLLLPGDDALGERGVCGKVAAIAHPAMVPQKRVKPGAAPSLRPARRRRTAAGRS